MVKSVSFQALVQALVKYGRPNLKLGNKLHWNWTPIHWAVLQDNVGIIKILLEAGADPDIKDSVGRTPAKLADEHYKDKVIKFFKERK